MSNQIKRTDIAEEGVLDNLIEPLKALKKLLDDSDKQLKTFASTIERDLKFGEKTKELREFTEVEQKLNKVYEEKKKVQRSTIDTDNEIVKLKEKLSKLNTEEAKEVAELKEQIRLQNTELRNQAKGLKGTGDAYQILVKETRNAKNESKELGAQLKILEREGKQNTDQYKQLASQYQEVSSRAAKMDKELKEIDKTVGDNFRNVGNYESAFDALNKEVARGGLGFRDLRKKIQEYQSIAAKAGRTTPIGQKAIREAAKLQDEMDTLTQSTKALADDGANLKAALQFGEVVASSYQGVLAAQQLLGVESEKVLEVMAKIQAVQVILNGLNKVRNSLDKASILSIKAKTIAQNLFNVSMQKGTLAVRRFNVAMKASVAGAIIAGVVALAANWEKVSDALTGTTKKMRLLKDTQKEVANTTADLRTKIMDMQISFDLARKGVIDKEEALKKYNDEFGDTLGFAENLNEAEQIYADKTEAYIKATMLRAQAQILLQKAAEAQIEALLASEDDQRNIAERTSDAVVGIQSRMVDFFTGGLIGFSKKTDELQEQNIKIAEQRTKTAAENQADLFQSLAKELMEQAAMLDKEFELGAKKRDEKAERRQKEAIKRRKKLRADELKEEEKDAGKSLDERMKAQENMIRRQSELEKIANLEQATTQEEFNELERERLRKQLEDLIQLRKDYNEDTLSLEVQLAEHNKEFAKQNEQIIEQAKENIFDIADSVIEGVANIYNRAADQSMMAYQQQEQQAAQLYGTLEALAAEGNLNAEQSLSEMLEIQQKAQREQLRIQQRQQRIEQARQVFSIIQSQLDAGKSPGEAIASTGGYMSAIQGLISSLPSFYEGTEDTGKARKALDNKGGRLAVLHNNERVLTAQQNKALAGIPNPMIPTLVQKGLDSAGNSYDLLVIDELQKTRKAIESMPQTTYEVQKVMGEFASLIARTKKGNTTTQNKYS